MKKYLLTSIVAYISVISAKRYMKRALTLAAVSLLFAGAAFAQATKITGLTVSPTQSGAALTYGTGASVTYTVTITSSTGNQNGSENFTFNWTGGTPTGVTLSPATNFNPRGVTTPFTLTVTTSNTTAAGTYNFTITSTHTGGTATSSVSSSLVIGKRALTITATGPAKTYGTALTAGASGSNFTATGAATGQSVTSVTLTPDAAGLSASTAAGAAYVITPSAPTGTGGFLASNYNITFNNLNSTVTKAPLTVIANNQTKNYGATFTFAGTEFTVTGLKNSDAVTSATLTSTGSAATATAAGSPYPIVPSAAVGTGLANYTISYTNGTMTVNPAALTITATGLPATKNYGVTQNIVNNSTNFTITSGTLIAGQSVTSVTLTPDVTPVLNLNAYTPAGSTYILTPSNAVGAGGFLASNYNITYVGFTGTVVPAPITITATGPAKVYGTALTTINNSTANFTETGAMAPGESITTVNLTPSGPGISATAPVGSAYTITPSGAVDILNIFGFIPVPAATSNYAITYVPFTTGAVTPAPLTITANPVSKPLGATLTSPVTGSTAFTTNAGGLQNGETVGSVTITYGTGSASNAPIGANANQVTPSAATGGTFTASNYTITYASNTLTVVAGIYNWTGANSTNWATPQNWNVNGVQQTSSYPGSATTTDMVQIGVVAYTSGNQPTVAATLPNPISSLTFGGATTSITLNLNASVNLTVSGNTTLNAGSEVVNTNGAAGSSINIGGTFTNNTGATFNSIGSEAITITGAYTSIGTTNFGSGPVTMSNSYTNSGITTFGTGLVTFNSTTSQDFLTGTAVASTTTFKNVLFTGGASYKFRTTPNGSAGNFNLASTGVLTLSNNTTIIIANSTVTLLSDINSTASIAAIPAGCQINGNVTVQRYVSAHRGYRLLSSPVNTGTATPIYSLNYVKNSAYVLGTTGAAGGFDTPPAGNPGNPSLFIYREDVAYVNNSFLTGNFRGISNISQTPLYTTNPDGPAFTFNMPVSAGFMLFYRGNRASANIATEAVTSFVATEATMSTTGPLNQGQIKFINWFNGSTTLSFTPTQIPTIMGFNLVGNPYASAIDWETYSNSNPNSGIYAPGTSDFVYQYNTTVGNYGVYEAGQGGSITTNGATRTIESGQGFFVQAITGAASLTFNESAKNTTLANTGPNLFMSKKPVDQVATIQLLHLQMALDTINTDDIIIQFRDNATTAFDIKEDALYKLGSNKVNLSSISSDGKFLAVNRLPSLQKVQTTPLKVGASAYGTYTLNATQITGIPMLYDIWLMDAFTKDSVDMRKTKSYTFDITTDTLSYGAYRFKLVIRQNPAMAYQLVSFTAAKTPKKDVELDWVTKNEQNYTRFTVERSTNNGRTYNVVGSVASTGAGNYSLVDKNPSDQNLYRLKQVDVNDSITYSKIVSVDFSHRGDQAKTINVYPNPARDRLTLSIDAKAQAYKIQITNGWGLILQQTTSRESEWQTNVSRFMPGTYYIQVLNEKDRSVIGQTKFVKL